jgi:metal-responsive CopG/Arc/MetJ family transcriptional regulator
MSPVSGRVPKKLKKRFEAAAEADSKGSPSEALRDAIKMYTEKIEEKKKK